MVISDGGKAKMDEEKKRNQMAYHVGLRPFVKSGIYFYHIVLNESYALHGHNFYELEIVTEGGCRECVNGEYVEVSAGDVYILTPNDYHNYILPESGGQVKIHSIRLYFSLVSDHVRECLSRIKSVLIPKVDNESFRIISSMAEQANEKLKSTNPFMIAAAEYMLDSIICMLTGMENTFSAAKINDKSYISLLLKYVSENYREDIDLADAAEKLAISKGYLSSLINSYFGRGFPEILNDYRIRQVTCELLSTNKSVTDICYDAGYQDCAHFSRVFKRCIGMTPTQFRKSFEGKVEVDVSSYGLKNFGGALQNP